MPSNSKRLAKRRQARKAKAVAGSNRIPFSPLPKVSNWQRRLFLRALKWKIRSRYWGSSPQSKQRQKATRTLIRWFRTTGFGAILLGWFGLMQTFFWPSVIAVYLGVIILLLDLWFENFGRMKWFKVPIFFVAIVVTSVFTKAIVLHEDKVSSAWIMNKGKVRVFITNDSTDDLREVTLDILPDHQKLYVTDAVQITTLPGVSFADSSPIALRRKGDGVEFSFNTNGTPGIINDTHTNFLRVRCDSIPRDSSVVVEFSLLRQKGRDTEAVYSASHIDVEGEYKGAFRKFSYKNASEKMPSVF